MPEYIITFRSGAKVHVVADSVEHARQKARDRVTRIAASGGNSPTADTQHYLKQMQVKKVEPATNRNR